MNGSRVDCALGIELKTIRMKNNMTLITMSKAMFERWRDGDFSQESNI